MCDGFVVVCVLFVCVWGWFFVFGCVFSCGCVLFCLVLSLVVLFCLVCGFGVCREGNGRGLLFVSAPDQRSLIGAACTWGWNPQEQETRQKKRGEIVCAFSAKLRAFPEQHDSDCGDSDYDCSRCANEVRFNRRQNDHAACVCASVSRRQSGIYPERGYGL